MSNSRRDFLKTVGVVGAGALVAPGTAVAALPQLDTVTGVVCVPNAAYDYLVFGSDAGGQRHVYGGHNDWSWDDRFPPSFETLAFGARPAVKNGKDTYDLIAVGERNGKLQSAVGFDFYDKPRFNSGGKDLEATVVQPGSRAGEVLQMTEVIDLIFDGEKYVVLGRVSGEGVVVFYGDHNDWAVDLRYPPTMHPIAFAAASEDDYLVVGIRNGEAQSAVGFDFFDKPRFNSGGKDLKGTVVQPRSRKGETATMATPIDVFHTGDEYVVVGLDANGNVLVLYGEHNDWEADLRYPTSFVPVAVDSKPRVKNGKDTYDLIAVGDWSRKNGPTSAVGFEFYGKPRFNSGGKPIRYDAI
jgi:hypothetical protein